MEHSTKDEVMLLFEKHRKVPGAAYEEQHFLDYLIENPEGRGVVRNSFSGLRRFNAFIDELQLKYSIFFSVKDRETDYAVDDFVKRIEALRLSKSTSLASLENQMKQGIEWNLIVFANIIILVPMYLFKGYAVVLAFFILLLAVINVLIIWIYLKEVKYQSRLRKQIQGKK